MRLTFQKTSSWFAGGILSNASYLHALEASRRNALNRLAEACSWARARRNSRSSQTFCDWQWGERGQPASYRRHISWGVPDKCAVLHVSDFWGAGGFFARAFSTCRQLPVHLEHKIKAIQNAYTQNLILESEQCFVTVSYCLSLTLAATFTFPEGWRVCRCQVCEGERWTVCSGSSSSVAAGQWSKLAEDSIMRQYSVQLSPRGLPEILFHKDLYKISGQGNPISIDQSGSQLLTFDGVGDNSAANDSTGNAGKLKEIKAQLREMSGMDENQYKSTLRRLYLTWHPDKAGNTPFNNMILHLLVKHKQWYLEGGGDDSWLADFEDHQADTGCNNTEAQACSAGLARSSDDIGWMMLCRCPCSVFPWCATLLE